MFVLALLEHKLLYGSIFLIILINLGCILYLVMKERKKDREEIDDIVSSLAAAKPREEKVEKVETIEPPKGAMEIEKVLEKMQKDLEATPEEVVSTFEKDQEEKAIISYQELVSTLKQAEPAKEKVKESLKENMILEDNDIDKIDIEDDILVKQVEAVPEFIEEKKIVKVETEEKPKAKFKNTEFISPIFGKMSSLKDADYPTVPAFSKEEKLEELLEEVPLKMTRSSKNNLEETLDIEPLQEEIRKNDEFLRALKNFRSNL